MSYCRWGYGSDVYVYANVSGAWTIHVAEIGLPRDGETFHMAGPQECADQLLALRELGYKVPQHAIDALLKEEKEPA